MAPALTPELRTAWLSAVLLPGFDDPRESCLAELSEYTGLPREEVLARCLDAVAAQRRMWHEAPRESADSVVAFYDQCDAYIYELLWWHALEQGEAPIWNARLLDIARRAGASTYLDFGAGIGTNAILLSRAGLDVTIADVSSVLQRFAEWRLRRRGLAARAIDLKHATLESERYDLISAVDVLEHVPDPLATLEQLRCALRPGGTLVFDQIASSEDARRPFHLLRSKYPIRSRVRGMGYEVRERFQKFLVLKRIERSPWGNRLLRGWDILRWRLYYLAQGEWPRARAGLAEMDSEPAPKPARAGGVP